MKGESVVQCKTLTYDRVYHMQKTFYMYSVTLTFETFWTICNDHGKGHMGKESLSQNSNNSSYSPN